MLKVLCISSSALLFACSVAGGGLQYRRSFSYNDLVTLCGQIDSPHCSEGDNLELGQP